MRIEPADDAMFGERDAWCYEPPYDFYDSDGLPVKNPEFFFAARDDDGTLIGFYFLEPRDGALFYGFGMRLDLTGRGLGEQFVVETFDGYGSVELIDMESSTEKSRAECDDPPTSSSLAPQDSVGLVVMLRQSSVRIGAPREPKRQRICRNPCRR